MSGVLIALGSALGGVSRYWLGEVVTLWLGPAFPWGTLLINVLGSVAIGLFATLTGGEGRFPVALEWRQFFMVGVCGGFTTFSSFSLQTLALAQDGEWGRAAAYILLSVALCLGAVWLGHVGGLALNR